MSLFLPLFLLSSICYLLRVIQKNTWEAVMTRFLHLAAIVLVGLGLSGCSGKSLEKPTGCPISVDNVYSNPGYRHSGLLNVLLLPLDNPMCIENFDMHHEEMVLAILRSFGKEHYFNLHHDPHFDETACNVIDMETGMYDRVKLGAIGEEYNSQAVLKVSVNDFRAYPPMRMKVKAVLIDTSTAERIWAFDHVFDADDANVINAMKLWWNSDIAGGDTNRNRFSLATVRPSFFSKFVFHSMARSYDVARVENVHRIRQLERQQAAFERRQQETDACGRGCR